MKPFVFEISTPVTATPEALYAFHENPQNIHLIAPRSLIVQQVVCAPHAKAGDTFRIEARQFGLPIRWTGQWEKADSPHLLVDTALSSPFAFWRHSHSFSKHPQGGLLTDRVEYLLKGGFAGALASRWVLPWIFAGMFRSRHAATRRYFKRQ
jgi:ligand-binding SRPBCC domain-containing protein